MAIPSLRILLAAERDITEACAWYENRKAELGSEFLQAVDTRLRSIQHAPETCPIVTGHYRRALVGRFPYSILYTIEDQVVMVYAVFHTARDPQKWRDRIAPE